MVVQAVGLPGLPVGRHSAEVVLISGDERTLASHSVVFEVVETASEESS